MALVVADSAGAVIESDAGGSPESLDRLLDSQRELFHSQIEQLQRLVVAQCKLTGVNPLAQEMAAGALSIKIGKRPRDLLNPKAVKYMQSVFSIKDTIGKKETREISALCGVTVSQVREFFAGQRSRVRKFVRLSREKATRSEASKASSEENSLHVDKSQPLSEESSVNAAESIITGQSNQIPTNAGIISESIIMGQTTQIPMNVGILTTVQDGQQNLVVLADNKSAGEAPSSSSKEESASDIDSDDKKFIDDIFNLMRKEKTFTGQVKLMEWVLRIHNLAVLNWFLTKGGITILATWLSQAAQEEQTSVLLVIFKVLCHLPLQKVLPTQMSDILQTVNKLRFYRFSDISHRARVLLSRWSKQFFRSQGLKKTFNNSCQTAYKGILCKQSINEIIGADSWQSKVDIPEDILLSGNKEYSRKSEPREKLKLLPASSDDSNKKSARSVSSSKSKERRKVLLVEQLDRKGADKSMQVARAMSLNNSRPISADDIQKAKMRAMFMQNKYGKIDPSTSENKLQKKDVQNQFSSETNCILPASRKLIVNNKLSSSITEKVPCEMEANLKQNTTSTEKLFEKLTNNQIKWQTPPVMKIDTMWSVATGENSKEVEVQTQRNRREKETFYSSPHDIPLNPKEPWDVEMDFDDSLTPEIPTEQPPDADVAESSLRSPHIIVESVDEASATTSAPSASNGAPEPDLELLAVLLKNPDLVFALTSNQGMNLKSEEMVALLDLLKSNSNGLIEMMNRLSQSKENGPQEISRQEPEPTSLPSPTPPSDSARMAWRSELPNFARRPVLQPLFSGDGGIVAHPSVLTHIPAPSAPEVVKNLAPGLGLPPQTPTILSMPQMTANINFTIQNPSTPNNLPNIPSVLHSSLSSNILPNTSSVLRSSPASVNPSQQTASDIINLPSRQFSVTNASIVSPLLSQQESFGHSSLHVSSLPIHSSLPNSLQSHPALYADPSKLPSRISTWPPAAVSAPGSVRRDTTPDKWNSTPYGLSDVPNSDERFSITRNNYNAYSNRPVPSSNMFQCQRVDRNGIGDRAELESWSPGGSPVRSREFRHNDEVRRANGWTSKPEGSRHWTPGGSRDGHRSSGSRRRDHDHSRRR